MFQPIFMDAAAAPQGGGLLEMLPFLVAIFLMFFLMNRSNKKREREAQEVRDSMQVGDEIETIGGIVARVVRIEQDTVLIESGADRTILRMSKGAIGRNVTATERSADEKKSQQQAKEDAKAAKKKGKDSKEDKK